MHEEAVMLCCKHNKAVITTKPLGRNAEEGLRMLKAVEEAGIFNGYLEDLVYTPKFIKAMVMEPRVSLISSSSALCFAPSACHGKKFPGIISTHAGSPCGISWHSF